MSKSIPFSQEQIADVLKTYPTPFYLYDESGIRDAAQALLAAFSWNEGFQEYFAVKATPNPAILEILQQEGLGLDCSSMAELILAERTGFSGETIMFTSNNTPASEFAKAKELGAIINLDALEHLAFLEAEVGLPELLSFRYNPGAVKTGNAIIGEPQESKFGLTREQLITVYRLAQEKGVRRFGLHTMVVSNELDVGYFVETAVLLFNLIAELSQTLGITFEFVNLGGGIGIPYRPEETAVNLPQLGAAIEQAYQQIIVANGLPPLKLFLECGRVITGPHGYLITAVRHVKSSYKQFVGLDASMADLMRPGMYGAYHHVTSLGNGESEVAVYDLVGSLCENNDKFAIDRTLATLAVGDLLVIHDVGAHGRAMGFNYNGKLRSAELLLQSDGQVALIRRAETLDDYFATLAW
ncbi:MAG: diaminopimelate decarboxylase [Chloroflexota bacterium]